MSLDIHTIDELNELAPKTQAHRLTDIREAVKDRNRVNIYIDGKFFCSLDISQVVDFHLKIGQEIDADLKQQLKRASDFGKLYSRTLEYVFSRPHSVKEVRDYLHRKTLDKPIRVKNRKTNEYVTQIRKGYDESLIEPILKRLNEHGYLDDEKFARAWIENRNTKKGTSLKKLRNELALKGVDSRIVDRVLSEDLRNDRDELRKVIARKQNKYDDRQKLIQYLMRQGFNYSDVLDELSGIDDSSSWPA